MHIAVDTHTFGCLKAAFLLHPQTSVIAARRTMGCCASSEAAGPAQVANQRREPQGELRASASRPLVQRLHDSPGILMRDPNPPAKKHTDCSRHPVLAGTSLNEPGLKSHAGVTALTPSKPSKPDQSLGCRCVGTDTLLPLFHT